MPTLSPEWAADARRLVDECALDGLTLELPLTDAVGPVQWHRLPSGAALGWPELAAGLAVSRRVTFPSVRTPVPLAHMSREIVRERGQTLVLSAEAGEGKSTYLHQLAYGGAPEMLILRWATARPLDLPALDSLRRVVSTVLEPVPDLVVVAEIQPGERPSALVEIADSCLEQVGGVAPTVLLAARPREAGILARRTNARVLQFAPRSLHEAQQFRSSLARCVDELGPDAEELHARYPSLEEFMTRSEEEQLKVYLQLGQPLIVSLLQATYGERFRTRLASEITDLLSDEPDRQAAYLVYLASVAGRSVTDDVLGLAFPGADIEARGANDPWTRTSGENFARHRLIAQTAIQEAGPNAALRGAINRIFHVIADSPDIPPLVRGLILAGAGWEPIALVAAEEPTGEHMKGELIRLIRGAVERNRQALMDSIERSSAGELDELLEWSRALHSLVPHRPANNHRYLVEMGEEVLVNAHNLVSLAEVGAARRVRYLRDKARAALATMDAPDGAVPFGLCVDWVSDWASQIDVDWPSADFLFDTFGMVDRLLGAYDVAFGADLEASEADERLQMYKYLVEAYFHSELLAGRSAEQALAPRYARRIGQEAATLGWPRYRSLLQHGWDTSKALGIPSVRAAALLGLALHDHGEDRRQPTLWEEVIEQLPRRAFPVYRLARCWSTPAQALMVRDVAEQGLRVARNRVERAHFQHALALVSTDAAQEECFRLAVKEYVAATTSDEWRAVSFGNDSAWVVADLRSACESLTRLVPEANVMHEVGAATARLSRKSR